MSSVHAIESGMNFHKEALAMVDNIVCMEEEMVELQMQLKGAKRALLVAPVPQRPRIERDIAEFAVAIKRKEATMIRIKRDIAAVEERMLVQEKQAAVYEAQGAPSEPVISVVQSKLKDMQREEKWLKRVMKEIKAEIEEEPEEKQRQHKEATQNSQTVT
jgi:chromosome segregation ATPase